MLQILTGRFFEGQGKLERKPVQAILYSNWDWVVAAETPVGVLERSRYGEGTVASYVFNYVNQYEKYDDDDRMVLAESNEAVSQFRTLCTVWFRSVFHPNRAFVESLVSRNPRHLARYLNAQNSATWDEVQGFCQFLDDVLSLPRKTFLQVMACARAFTDSVEAITTNFDVAYSLLVYMLEALGKASGETFTPTWADYEEGQRKKIDAICATLDPGTVDALRAVLTNSQHLKLSKRFVGFVLGHVQDGFYTREAEGRKWAIRKSELPRLLRNVYTTRSGFVHELRHTSRELKYFCIDPAGDVVRVRGDVHLSYSGLVRLARHVLLSLVSSAPKVQTEAIDWREQLPGRLRVQLAPDYWIWDTRGFGERFAKFRFNGVVAYFMDLFTKHQPAMIDLQPLIEAIESMFPTARAENRPALGAMYWLYNKHIVPEYRAENWEAKLDTFMQGVDGGNIETLALAALMQWEPSLSGSESEGVFRAYVAQRHQPLGVHLPPRLEEAILCHVANTYLNEGKGDDFRRLLDEVVSELAGFPELQASLTASRDRGRPVELAPLLGQPASSPPRSAEDPAVKIGGSETGSRAEDAAGGN